MTRIELDWLLDDLVTRVSDIDHAIVLSGDGLVLAACARLSPADAEHLAAVAAGLHSLAKAAADQVGGGLVRQTLVEWERHLLRLTMAGEGACLAVLARREVDLGLLAYEMEMLIARVGQYLSSPARTMPGGTVSR
ncbi:roadblock/LC7 domain-containing protein [Thermoactinospora rubra]|uniref:roadblock/LC7 domain-containing protein n=1 Tax=Thermoactinospora rubra TaxID=1088767 RepID=UPI000A11C87C|nr:roadblock/LC7 domain-containing protein [Thermoactinospora rubra]